jgi:hypothetical protein
MLKNYNRGSDPEIPDFFLWGHGIIWSCMIGSWGPGEEGAKHFSRRQLRRGASCGEEEGKRERKGGGSARRL